MAGFADTQMQVFTGLQSLAPKKTSNTNLSVVKWAFLQGSPEQALHDAVKMEEIVKMLEMPGQGAIHKS